MNRYFRPCKLFNECADEIKPEGRYIYAFFPHGVYPVGGAMGTEIFQDFKIMAAAASVLFYIPILRRFISWVGAFPATKETILRNMKNSQPGTLFTLSVGGISE